MNQSYLIFVCAALGVMAFLAWRYFESRLRSTVMSNSALEQEVEDLQGQLDKSIRKEQRSSREATEYKQVREGLLTALSHEIRTPLNGIMGMASLLNETSLTPEQLEYTRTIHSSGEHLLTTVNRLLAGSILNLSKSGSLEDTPPESKDFSLREAFEDTLQLFAGKAAKKGIDLLYIIAAEVPEIICGDRKRLSQVLVNLVENAVRHTHTGEITITAGMLRTAEKESLDLCFEVRDTGAGIPPEKLEQLFKGIGAADETTEEDQPAGLGLVICKRLVETMSGFIEAVSEPGRGSKFTFTIRAAKSRQEARRSAAQQRRAFEGRQVLVVDTHEARRNALVRRLERMQMLPVAADSVRNALGMLSRHPAIDLLISNPPYISPSDFRNGTTARSVRLFEPRLALVPPIKPSPSLNANASAGDVFYQRLLELSLAIRARLTVLECGDKKQAERVVEMFRGMSETLERKGGSVTFTARIWPGTEDECRANGFHVVDGSRCVVIRRGMSF